jgi:hypothetical protein
MIEITIFCIASAVNSVSVVEPKKTKHRHCFQKAKNTYGGKDKHIKRLVGKRQSCGMTNDDGVI